MVNLSQWPLWLALPLCWGVGRLLLALLPAGEPGGGRIGEAPLVGATAFGLGWLALEAESHLLTRLGFEPALWQLLVPWAALCAIQWITRPGRVVPRHALRQDPIGLGERWCWRIGWAVSLLTILLRMRVDARMGTMGEASHVLLEIAAWVATLEILKVLRLAGWLRALLFMVGSAMILVHEHGPVDRSHAVLLMASTSGLLAALTWARRADRRSRILCSLLALMLCAQGVEGCCIALALAGSLLAGTGLVRLRTTLIELAPALILASFFLLTIKPLQTEAFEGRVIILITATLGLAALAQAKLKQGPRPHMEARQALALWLHPLILLACMTLRPFEHPLSVLLLLPGLLGLVSGLAGPLERTARIDPYPTVNGIRTQ